MLPFQSIPSQFASRHKSFVIVNKDNVNYSNLVASLITELSIAI